MLLSLMIDYLRKQMSMVLHFLSSSDGWSAHLACHCQASSCPLPIVFVRSLAPSRAWAAASTSMCLSDGRCIIHETAHEVQGYLDDMVSVFCQLTEKRAVEVEFHAVGEIREANGKLMCHGVEHHSVEMVAHVVSPGKSDWLALSSSSLACFSISSLSLRRVSSNWLVSESFFSLSASLSSTKAFCCSRL